MKRKIPVLEMLNEKSCPAKSIPVGEILTDLKDKKWKLGSSIGIGGFGEIYLASDDLSKPVPCQSDFVIKVEPFMSGPLFVEIHVYANIGKKELINQYIASRKLKSLGMPHYLSCGSHYYNNERYRFIVLPKYGIDLETVFLNSGKRFSVKTVFTLATYVIDVLEYIHSNGYVHADIKASNLVLDKENGTPVYLLDYGLSCKFYDDIGNHKKLELDQRKAHNGTLIFTSRDAHSGAHSRRGDLETLGYNLIQWITGSLPWEADSDAEMVAEYKKKMMSNIDSFIEECYNKEKIEITGALIHYLKYVNKLKFKSKPDYQYCRNLFKQGVRDAGFTFNGNLSLNDNWLQVQKKRYRCNSDRENNNKFVIQKSCAIPVNSRRPCALRNFNPRLTRKSTHSTVQFNWPKILAGHPEKPTERLPMYEVPREWQSGMSGSSIDSSDSANSEALFTRGLDNPTPQMKLILERERFKERINLNNYSFNNSITTALRSRSRNVLPHVTDTDKVTTSTKDKITKKENSRIKVKKNKVIPSNLKTDKIQKTDNRKKVSFSKASVKRKLTRGSVSTLANKMTKKKSIMKSLYLETWIQNQRNTRRWTAMNRSITSQSLCTS